MVKKGRSDFCSEESWPWISLHNHSSYSILDSCCAIDDLVDLAVAHKMPALGLTDHDSISGAVQFVQACHRAGIHPVIGAELTLQDRQGDSDQIVVLCENDRGYRNLCRLLSRETHEFLPLTIEELEKRVGGLIGLSACGEGLFGRYLAEGRSAEAIEKARFWSGLFGQKSFFAEIYAAPSSLIDRIALAAGEAGVPLVGSANVHFEEERHRFRHEVIASIRTLTLLNEPCSRKRALGWSGSFLSRSEAGSLFGSWSEALTNSAAIAHRCRLSVFDEVKQ